MFVTVIDGVSLLVVVVVAVEGIIVACRVVEGRERVVLHGCYCRLRQYRAQFIQECDMRGILQLLGCRESVEADVLKDAGAIGVIKGIGQ